MFNIKKKKVIILFLLIVSLLIQGCSGGNSDLNIQSIKPKKATEQIIITPTIIVVFSEDVNTTTVTPSSFTVTDDLGNLINGNISVKGSKVKFLPEAPLEYGTTYDVIITTAVMTDDKKTLSENFTSEFTTEDAGAVTYTDLYHMRNNFFYRTGDTDKPIGDINRDTIGNVTADQNLIFSESASYYLYIASMEIPGADEDVSRELFDKYWIWIRNNLQRKNITQVYSWQEGSDNYHTWIDMPEKLKDHLLSWRWVETIENTDQSGIIYQTDDDSEGKWHDGSQVASDGDLLVAYALYLAYKRGWGDQYRDEALNMIQDIRKKILQNFTAGELLNTENNPDPSNIYTGTFVDEITGTFEKLSSTDSIAWDGKNNYTGFFFNLLDLTDLQQIEIVMKGTLGDNASVDFRLEDELADPIQTGHIYNTDVLLLSDTFKKYIFTKDDFKKFEHHGEQDGELNWSAIRNLQVQVSKKLYYQYSGTYFYLAEGSIHDLNDPERFSWEGNRCYYGFTFDRLMDLSDLSEVRIRLKGSGSVDLQISDGIESDIDYQGIAYHKQISLTSSDKVQSFQKNDFVLFPHGPPGTIDWNNIRRLQFQISSTTNARVEIDYIEIIHSDGRNYRMTRQLGDSEVAIKSITIKLTDGQTIDHNGYHVYSNGHGKAMINTSYFMPACYRVFGELDTEGSEVWEALLNKTFEDLSASLGLTLHDLSDNLVVSNGMLFPNWFELDPLKGTIVDVSTQTSESNVRGFQYGYDSFRTLFFLMHDFVVNSDSPDQTAISSLLSRIYPFYSDEFNNSDSVLMYPVYNIDGTPDPGITTEADFGFHAVYLNLFNLMNNQDNKDTILSLFDSLKRTSPDEKRSWIFIPGSTGDGEGEYFMNAWSIMGMYLYLMQTR